MARAPQRASPAVAAPASSFVQLPGLLIIRLMSRCNQRCAFCMVGDEVASSGDVSYEEAARLILAQPPHTRVEFFGGEPTLHPRFLDLLTLARRRGHRCSIATNGRAFASEKLVQSVAALGPAGIYIRTSLYGDSPELHDAYTGCPGSYRQTSRGIRHIVAAGLLCQVNVVVMSGNVERLAAITALVHRSGVPRIKFGNLVQVASCRAHAVRLSAVRPHLQRAVTAAEALGLTVTIEKTPVCVAGGRLDLMSTERRIGRWPRAYDDLGACQGCLVRPWCEGLDPDYVAAFGYEGLERMPAVPRRAVSGTMAAQPEPEFLKHYCIEAPDGDLDEGTRVALYQLHLQIEAQLGRLVVFPRRFIK